MDYVRIYHSIIKNTINRNLTVYKELHHIIPNSIFSVNQAHQILKFDEIIYNDKSNIVALTAREHILCHLLLVKIFKGKNKNCEIKMTYAANNMTNTRKCSCKTYSWLKQQYSKIHSIQLKGLPSRAKGKFWSADAKVRKSASCQLKGKTYEEIYGEEKANELKLLRKESAKNRKNTNKGKTLSPRTKEHSENLKKSIQNGFKNGRKAYNKDLHEYSFMNVNTGNIRKGTREFLKSFGDMGDINYLIKTKDSISRKGWKYISSLEF